MKLTDLTVRNLTDDGTQKTHFDDALPNFGIRIGKRRKTWTVLVGAARHRITIGHYPAMSLKEARAAAAIAFTKPISVKTPTFDAALELYCRQHLPTPSRAPHGRRNASSAITSLISAGSR